MLTFTEEKHKRKRQVRWVHGERTEADRVVRRATTRFGVLNMRVPRAPVTYAGGGVGGGGGGHGEVEEGRNWIDRGATSGMDHEHKCRKMAATARLLERGDMYRSGRSTSGASERGLCTYWTWMSM